MFLYPIWGFVGRIQGMDTLFFVISKLAWGLLSPLNLMIWLTLLGALLAWWGWRRFGGTLATLGFALLLANMAYPFGDLIIQPLEARFHKPHPMPDDVDGILILGGGESLGRSLSWQTPELGLGGDRYVAAAYLARLYKEVPVIFAGGSGSVQLQDTGKEGDIARTLLTQLGIHPNRLIIESSSRNTHENFRNVRLVLPKPDGRYLLITSAFHMPRAVGVARKVGVNVIPYPVDYRSYKPPYRAVDFDFFDHLKSLEPGWKEWIGLTVYYLSGKTDQWLPAESGQ